MHQREKLSLEPHHGKLGIHPCMVIRLCPTFYHFILLPRLPREQLLDIARTQAQFQPDRGVCLVLGPDEPVVLWCDRRGDPAVLYFLGEHHIRGTVKAKHHRPGNDEDLKARRAVLSRGCDQIRAMPG